MLASVGGKRVPVETRGILPRGILIPWLFFRDL
jgi:hypothetical protein